MNVRAALRGDEAGSDVMVVGFGTLFLAWQRRNVAAPYAVRFGMAVLWLL